MCLVANKKTHVEHVALLDSVQKLFVDPAGSCILHASVTFLQACSGPEVPELQLAEFLHITDR